MAKYTVTANKVYQGDSVLKRGDSIEMDAEDYAASRFWQSSAKPVEGKLTPDTPAAAKPVEGKLTPDTPAAAKPVEGGKK